MKVVLIIAGLLLAAFAAVQVFFMSSQKNIESYRYDVVRSYDKFEIRNYAATLFTSVKLQTSDYDKASSRGFSTLAGYIFGGNEKNESIAMTSPVSMSLEDEMRVMFMVPKKYTKENLPKPNQAGVIFRKEPARKMAAISFSGWANSEKIAEQKAELIAALNAEGIPYTNNFFFFGYNAPYEVFNRKNEVAVELD